jgi:hypothetical protein
MDGWIDTAVQRRDPPRTQQALQVFEGPTASIAEHEIEPTQAVTGNVLD